MPTPKQGSGDVLGEIDLGVLGTLCVEDDGCPDRDVRVILDGEYVCLKTLPGWGPDFDDQELIDSVDVGPSSNDDSQETTQQSYSPVFSCHDCHNTWPGRNNQNPGSGPNICPDCAE